MQNKSKEELLELCTNMASALLSIQDSLKLLDGGCIDMLEHETLSQIMYRKMFAYNVDLNNILNFTHLSPQKDSIVRDILFKERELNIKFEEQCCSQTGGCCQTFEDKILLNGEEVDCDVDNLKSVLKAVLEHIGYEVNIESIEINK